MSQTCGIAVASGRTLLNGMPISDRSESRFSASSMTISAWPPSRRRHELPDATGQSMTRRLTLSNKDEWGVPTRGGGVP